MWRQAGWGVFLTAALEAVLPPEVAAPVLSGPTRVAAPDRVEGRWLPTVGSHRPSSAEDL
ncbi:hypothetical protein SSP531S_00250 [Streptomyces spongiicola]|uniref:Uncharacterized protein n=1 Tax=Streptomyces spongiicola TaxID=1690221 RepID=A0A388SR72_9ACTN|nr:hypothetical protein SSP531S_00250 [Streptomyces spongiicola]